MANELVKYRNALNRVPFRKFKRREFNIFFALVSRMRNKGTRKIKFSYDQLEKLSGLNYSHHQSRFTRDLWRLNKKMQHLTINYKDSHHLKSWVLFPTFDIDTANKTLTVGVNPDEHLILILNKLYSNFTRFSLAQFTSLKSSYSKTMFRILKSFRTTGYVNMPIKKFRRLLCIPKSYSNGVITRRVIKPIAIELTPLVRGLRITQVHHGIGGKISGYIFTFHPEMRKQNDFSKGVFGNKREMLDNVKLNPYLRPSYKRKALENITGKVQKKIGYSHRPKREPIKIFNHVLKTGNLDYLEYLLHLHKERSKAINLSEYQARKLRKTIRSREDTKLSEDKLKSIDNQINVEVKRYNTKK